MADEFVALSCPKCGGEVQVQKARMDELFLPQGEGAYLFIGVGANEQVTCTHCKTSFVRRQRVQARSPVQVNQYVARDGALNVHVQQDVKTVESGATLVGATIGQTRNQPGKLRAAWRAIERRLRRG